MKFQELLDLVDKWPKTMKWRCRDFFFCFRAKNCIVTSVLCPQEVYSNVMGGEEESYQLLRRFEIIQVEDWKIAQK
jgi:hypothetical protein